MRTGCAVHCYVHLLLLTLGASRNGQNSATKMRDLLNVRKEVKYAEYWRKILISIESWRNIFSLKTIRIFLALNMLRLDYVYSLQ